MLVRNLMKVLAHYIPCELKVVQKLLKMDGYIDFWAMATQQETNMEVTITSISEGCLRSQSSFSFGEEMSGLRSSTS